MTIPLQAPSLVEKGGAGSSSLLHTTLEGPTEYVTVRWMWSLHGFLHGIEQIMFRGHLDCFWKPLLWGRSNTRLGDQGTPNAHNRWFILFYHAWRHAWNFIHWNSIWLRVCSHVTLHYTWGSMSTLYGFWRCLGTAFGHFLLGSHDFMVTTCVYSGPNLQILRARTCSKKGTLSTSP